MTTLITMRRSQTFKRMAILLALAILFIFVAPCTAHADDDMFTGFVSDDGTIIQGSSDSANELSMGNLVLKYRKIASIITGILTVTMLIFMLLQFSKLGAAGDNEQARKKAISGILTTGIATALLGSATIIIGFFWNALADIA